MKVPDTGNAATRDSVAFENADFQTGAHRAPNGGSGDRFGLDFHHEARVRQS